VGDDSVAICLKPSNSLLCEEAMGRSRSPHRYINTRREEAMGRSRSPRRYINTRQISKVVAMFGRHPEQRPAGLYVDETSSFFLSDFMQCWANDHGLSRDDVLDALHEHKYNERNDYRRFKISKVPCMDDYIIKVYDRENGHVKTRYDAGMAPWRCRREQNWENKPRHDDDETHHDKDPEPMYPDDEEANDKDPEAEYPDEKDPLWIMYEDSRNPGTTWWYYEGPKGKWFMKDGDTKPQPWWDDSGDFDEEHHDDQGSAEEGLQLMRRALKMLGKL
jgi:hypothetical protein